MMQLEQQYLKLKALQSQMDNMLTAVQDMIVMPTEENLKEARAAVSTMQVSLNKS